MELTYEATPTETSAPDVVELALIGKPNALSLFQPNGLDQIIDKIRDEVALHVPDISTERGRKAIGSLARKVASSKVRLDDLGKELVCEVKAQVGQIDAERKRMRDELDQLRDDTRRPLTEWEDAEKNRLAAHEDAINEMLSVVPMDTLEGINQQVQRVESFATRNWQEFKARYGRAMDQAMARLNDRATAIRVQAEERAELARLQKLEAERLRVEREERIKAQAAAEAKAAAEARALEEAEAAERAAKAERERIQREKEDAEARATRAEAARVEAIEAAIREAEETAARVERARVAEETRQRKEAARVEYDRIEAEAKAKQESEARIRKIEEGAAKEKAEAFRKATQEREEAKRKAQAAADEAQRQKDAEVRARLEAEQRTRKAEETAKKAAKDAELAIERERERVAETKRIEEAATAKREANKKHRAGINRAAVAALMGSAAGLTEEVAILVVTAIAHGKVPNVSISY